MVHSPVFLWCCLPVVHALWFMPCLPVVHTLAAFPARGCLASSLFLWSALWSGGVTCWRRRGPVTSPGDASETRAEGAALPAAWCGPARPGEESAGKRLADHRGGQVTCTVSWAHSVSQGLRDKGPRTLSTPLPMRGSFFCFCMTAVAPCPISRPV